MWKKKRTDETVLGVWHGISSPPFGFLSPFSFKSKFLRMKVFLSGKCVYFI